MRALACALLAGATLLLGLAPAGAAAPAARVIRITAKRFEFAPAIVELKVGEPVVLELASLDRKHGFSAPDLHIDVVIPPGKPTRIRVVPDHAGTFAFHCSVFCGAGHEDMGGQIVVIS